MSKRVETEKRCDFCKQHLWEIAGSAPGQELYCYGCRETKDPLGWGFKSDLRDRLTSTLRS
jgi:hypothetical protein